MMTVMSRITVQPHKKFHDFHACLGIKIASGFVCKYDGRIVHERPGYGNPLLLTSGKLVRVVIFPSFQPNAFQSLPCALASFMCGHAVIQHRKFHVLQIADVRDSRLNPWNTNPIFWFLISANASRERFPVSMPSRK